MSENSNTVDVQDNGSNNQDRYFPEETVYEYGKQAIAVSFGEHGRARIAFGCTDSTGRFHTRVPTYVDVNGSDHNGLFPMHQTDANMIQGYIHLLNHVFPMLAEKTKEAMNSRNTPRSAPVVRHLGKTQRDREKGHAAAPSNGENLQYTHPKGKRK